MNKKSISTTVATAFPLTVAVTITIAIATTVVSTRLLAQVPMGLNPTQIGRDQTEATKITDRIYQATGFGNTFLVTTSEGNVVIDTALPSNAQRHKRLLQEIDDSPIKYIIITHAHGDHTGGIDAWREAETEVVAHQAHEEFEHYTQRLRGMFVRRNHAQYPDLPRATDRLMKLKTSNPGNFAAEIKPTILFDTDFDIELGGVTFHVMHTPGETYDALSVWIPELKAVFVGDNFYGSFPNIYTLRGTKPRWALDYVSSLNKILELEPEILIPSHGEALYGSATIREAVTKYRDAILYVHDETVAGMNQGKDVFTLMRDISLPEHLIVGEGYGAVSWSVRGIYEGYMGWFDGNASSMYSTPIDSVFPDIVAIAGGAERIAEASQTHLQDGKAVTALHLADIALTAEPENAAALQARLEALQRLLALAVNSNEAGWLRTGIDETKARLTPGQPEGSVSGESGK